MSNEIFEITKIMNNIKNHDFSVADFKITGAEGEIIMRCLKKEKEALEYDEKVKVPELWK